VDAVLTRHGLLYAGSVRHWKAGCGVTSPAPHPSGRCPGAMQAAVSHQNVRSRSLEAR
jgi:hypothetical protein